MGGDEFVDAFGVIGQAELLEQGWEAVGWVFHVGLLGKRVTAARSIAGKPCSYRHCETL
ncbi:hypothetical protein D3C71_1027340 [compost metagenome]